MNLTLPNQYDFVPRYFRLAVANVLSNIMLPLANLVSLIFLGHLPEIQHLAGVALAGNLLNFLYLILTFLRMGTTGVTAQAVGRNDREGLILVGLRNGLMALTIGIAIILLQHPLAQIGFMPLQDVPADVKASAFDYFSAQIWGAPAILVNFVLLGWFLGQEKNSLVVVLSFVGNFTKILFDYLFIVHWEWASTGAGLSYAISQYVALLLGLIFLGKEIQWQEIRAIVGKVWNVSAFQSTLTLNGNIFISNLVILVASLTFHFQGARMGTIIYTNNALLMQIFVLSSYFVEGLGFGTETLVGNFKGKGAEENLRSLFVVSLLSSLMVGLSFALLPVLFPHTIFGLLTNHTELIEHIDVYLPWLLPLVICSSVAWMLDGYFLGLAEGHVLRNASLGAMVLGFAPTAFAAWKYQNNHFLWLAWSLFYVLRMVTLSIQVPPTLTAAIEVSSATIPVLEKSLSIPLGLQEPQRQMQAEKLDK